MPCFFGGVSTYTAAEDRLPSRSGWSAARPPSGEMAHNTEPVGWHVGKVRFFGVGAKWKKQCETANFLVYYTKKDTGGLLNGEEARELSSRNYGTDEWWLLLDPTGSS